MSEIKCGCVARCSRGMLGLVTSETKVLTRYGDQAWTGVQLDPDKAGKEWCSRNPTFVANSVAELEQPWIVISERQPDQRDAAIRERENAVAFWQGELRERTAERDAARARVAELEAASGGGEQEPVAVAISPAERDGLQMIVDGVIRHGNGFVVIPGSDSLRAVESLLARHTTEPPQPRGWLTDEELEAVEASREFWQVECDCAIGDDTDRRYVAALSGLLARSSPPKVRLVRHLNYFDCHGDRVNAFDAADVLAALVAAGVEVEE